MNELLAKDSQYVRLIERCSVVFKRVTMLTQVQILDIRLFVLGDYFAPSRKRGDVCTIGEHSRIKVTYGRFDVQPRIESELEEKRGRIMVAGKQKDSMSM